VHVGREPPPRLTFTPHSATLAAGSVSYTERIRPPSTRIVAPLM
jgi:hypothetical protein